jgi:hypothetical protein
MRLLTAVISTLCVLFGTALVAPPNAAAAAAPQVINLGDPVWQAYLDSTGNTAAAATNTAVLNRLFANLSANSVVFVPDDAVYATNDLIHLPVDGTTIVGAATISAQNQTASAVSIEGNLVTVQGLRVKGTATTRNLRSSVPGASGFVVRGAGATLTDVQVRDVAAVGIMMIHAYLFHLVRPVVADSQADGIHMTSSSAFGTIDQPAVYGSGDDGISVVSYVDNASPVSNITVNDPVVWMSNAAPNYPYTYAWGRAYTVSGGQDITFNNVTAVNSAAAGVLIAAEAATGFNTYSVSGVTVNGGQLIDSNTDATLCAVPTAGCSDNGAVLIWSAQPGRSIQDVDIEGLTIQNTDANASRQVSILSADSAGVDQLLFRNLTFVNGPSTYFWADGTVPTTAYNTVCFKVGTSTVLTNHLGYEPIPSPGVTCGSPTS